MRRYMPQMDGLRAYSVFAVLVSHAFDTGLPIGTWGVIVFFVISGYLITGSLLTMRDQGLPLCRVAWAFSVVAFAGCPSGLQARQTERKRYANA